MALCEGGTLADVRHKLQKDFWPTFSAELTVWPVIQVGGSVSGSERPCCLSCCLSWCLPFLP